MYLPYAEVMRKHMAETTQMLNAALREDKNILFEGAQGTMLDIDHGTYPFVTSSSCWCGGALRALVLDLKLLIKCLALQKHI